MRAGRQFLCAIRIISFAHSWAAASPAWMASFGRMTTMVRPGCIAAFRLV